MGTFSHTFLLGECITGAGGEGGPLGIFLFVLKIYKTSVRLLLRCASKYFHFLSSLPSIKILNNFFKLQGEDNSADQ